jgi:hypothetical protein
LAAGGEGIDSGRELLQAGDGLLGRAAPTHEPVAAVHLALAAPKTDGERGCGRASIPFVPAVVDVSLAEEPGPAIQRPKQRRRSKASAAELEIDGLAVKISRGDCRGDRKRSGRLDDPTGSGAKGMVTTRLVDFRKGSDALVVPSTAVIPIPA